MYKFGFSTNSNRPLRTVLCLGAHSDDIEIGCGGSMLRLVEENPDLQVWWVVFSAIGRRCDEAINSADQFLSVVKDRHIITKEFRDGYFPYQGSDIKDFFETLKKEVSPDLIFTHYRKDLHQDHRVINELTWNTWRDHMILEYEIPKYDGDLGNPNFYIPLSRQLCQKKNDILCSAFETQEVKPWFTGETFWAMLQIRGIECRAEESLAEGFYARKISI
jgi:LmbE family N-acetylglucosaminyl deacetylase